MPMQEKGHSASAPVLEQHKKTDLEPSAEGMQDQTAQANPADFTSFERKADTSEPLSKARKRLFIGLITITAILLCLILLLGWGVPYIGFANIHHSIPYIAGFVFFLIIMAIAWSSLSLVLQIVTGRAFLGSKSRGLAIKLFLPLMELLGRVFGINPLEVRRSFIKVNNELVKSEAGKQNPDKVLILLPHCIQWSGCPVRINNNVDNCNKCGKCTVAGLIALSRYYGVGLAIATGGTIARRIVVDRRPTLILAVACERDLSSGIQDSYPLPVFGVLNERPYGPCQDTMVSLGAVEYALRLFIKQDSLPSSPCPDVVRLEKFLNSQITINHKKEES